MSRLAKPPLRALRRNAAQVAMLSLLLLALLGCPRKTTRKTPPASPLPTTAQALIAQIAADQLSYTTLALTYKATLLSEERRQNFTLRLHLLKDSLIWLSASFLSLEGARGLIRPDSVFLLQRLEKVLYYAATDTLRQMFPAYHLSDLANVFLGRWPVGISNLSWTWEPQTYTLSAPYQQAKLQAQLTPDGAHLAGWQVTLPNSLPLSLTYEWEDKPIPTRLTLTLPSDEKILLQLSDFTPHAPDLSFAFKVPPDYQRKVLFGK